MMTMKMAMTAMTTMLAMTQTRMVMRKDFLVNCEIIIRIMT